MSRHEIIDTVDELRKLNSRVTHLVVNLKGKTVTLPDIDKLNIAFLEIGSGDIWNLGKGTTTLTYLRIKNNNCRRLFTNQEEIPLKEIEIRKNRLLTLPLFHTRLQNLTIISNQLKNADTLSKLPNLIQLNLYNNHLTSLPDLSHLKYLQILTVSNNRLTHLNGLPDNLERIYAAHNNLQKAEVSHLFNLQHLFLHNNQLTSLVLPPCEKIILFNNQLHEIKFVNPNSSVRKKKYIQELDLTNNKLTHLPSFNYQHLTKFKINNNHLYSLPRLSSEYHPPRCDVSFANNWLTDSGIPADTKKWLIYQAKLDYSASYNNRPIPSQAGIEDRLISMIKDNFLSHYPVHFTVHNVYKLQNRYPIAKTARFQKTFRYYNPATKIKRFWQFHHYRHLAYQASYPLSLADEIAFCFLT